MRIWLPSTSASVMQMMRSYRSFSMSKSSPMPAPNAVIIALISALASMRSSLVFSTFKILPRSGKIAWKVLSRPCLALPPAESPSTKISHRLGSFSEQSANFPGNALDSSAPLRSVISRALRASSRARRATRHFWITVFATCGFSSKNVLSPSNKAPSTRPRMSALPSLVLVCPSNCGSVSFTLMTLVSPSRTSSPDRLASFCFNKPNFLA